MARKNVADAAKAKAEKQKKIAIGLIVLLALAGAYAVHTMMALNSGGGASSKPQVADTSTNGSAPVAAPAATTPLPAAPTLTGALPTDTTAAAPNGSSQLVDAVPTSAGTGQLQSFSLFESKDPFNAGGPSSSATGTKASTGSSGTSSGSQPASTSKPPKTPPAPPTPPPSAAVISVNGTSESVSTGSNFPAASPAFQLVALTATTAKVAVAGGSYASGAQTVTLKVNTPVTLVNTADGTRYTLTLLPQGTVPSAPAASSSGATTTTTPTTTHRRLSSSGAWHRESGARHRFAWEPWERKRGQTPCGGQTPESGARHRFAWEPSGRKRGPTPCGGQTPGSGARHRFS